MEYRYPKFELPKETLTPEGGKGWTYNGALFEITVTGLIWSRDSYEESDWLFMCGYLTALNYQVRGHRELV